MKLLSFCALFLLCISMAFAEQIAPPALSPSAFADTEASTNIVISPLVGRRSFAVLLSLDATASNCVEVAVGYDAAPADGALSHAESSLLFGWDCGHWFLDAAGLTNRVKIAPVGPDARKTLLLRFGLRTNGTVREIALLDGETVLPIVPFAMPAASFWNRLRVTVRGDDPAMENLVVRHSPNGTLLVFQ